LIPQRNISLLSNRLAKEGGRRIREDVLERDYCLAWFLAGLAESNLQTALAFKGGTALKRCYFGDYRFSEDLDFTLVEQIPLEEIKRRLEPVYAAVRENSGIVFAFDREDRDSHTNSYTFYLKYAGPLPAENDVKVDITIRERLVYPLQERPVLRGYEEFSDVPEQRVVRTYSLEEITAEKIIALADRARNEPRDLYDLWHLTSNAGVAVDHLKDAIWAKLEFRGQPCKGLEDAIRRKEARLKALWSGRLAYQMTKLPKFDEVFRAVRRALRQAHLP
jgi:predicted nucleotidyltransferase component of viral defense system